MGPPESGEALVGTWAWIYTADQHAADDPIVSDAADIPTEVIVDFTALLFDTLKFAADEFVSIGHDNPATRQPFSTAVMAPRLAPAYIAQLPETANIYFGINPTKGPARQKAGRGKEADITRLAVLPADLDFKNIGCGSPETARTIIGDLTAAMGTRPSVITESGHGLHAYWPVADGRDHRPGHHHRRQGTANPLGLSGGRRRRTAQRPRGQHLRPHPDVEGPRHLQQRKGSEMSIPVVAHAEHGHPLLIKEIDAALSRAGITEQKGERETVSGETLSHPDAWRYNPDAGCRYVQAMVAGWANDAPSERNPWMYNKMHKIAAACRLGSSTKPPATARRRRSEADA